MANIKCKDCGCACKRCVVSDHAYDVHLHVEIENLKQKLVERENHIVTMETNFLNEANKFPNGELSALREELLTWQDKYKRLYDAHRRVQRVNQGLEDKLLKLVDVSETDKNTLAKDVATLSQKLADANYSVKKLTDDNERYKNDVALAIQFLQCKQSNFVAHKFESLPQEVQTQVSAYITSKRKPEERKAAPEVKSIKVPIPTFPPTAMVYSVPPNPDKKEKEEVENPDVDIVSAAIMAKVLEERQRERACVKHCDTCTCSSTLKIVYNHTHHTVGTQTGNKFKEPLCLRCNSSLELNSLKIVKDNNPKKVPIYPNEYTDSSITSANNVVKVQPNNFLLDDSHTHLPSSKSSMIDFTSEASHEDSNRSQNLNSYDNVSLCNINEKTNKKPSKCSLHSKSNCSKPKLLLTGKHHRLCNKTSLSCEIESPIEEKANLEINVDTASAKNISSENLKGPRYCSMRLQSGSKNILLDNAHSNVAPVLYTRQHKSRSEQVPAKPHQLSHAESSSSEDVKNSSLVSSDSAARNEQRVAEWIQSTIDNELSSSENFRSDSVRNNNEEADKVRYAEMEENVKKFLFGKSEFLKTVELGKLKYLMIRENEKATFLENGSTKSNSHTETEI